MAIQEKFIVRCCIFVFALFLITSCQNNETELLQIKTSNGSVVFNAEIADSPERRRKGLMHRKELAPESVMLFEYEQAKKVSMWMKNTFIPLDMLFIDKQGTIKFIHERAEPQSTQRISSPVEVSAVLEMNAGLVKKFNIRKGDHVIHPFFE